MKKTIIIISLFSAFLSCSNQSNDEKVIRTFLQTQNGVTTDLKIEFIELNVKDITVSDSINILQKVFDAEKSKKIEVAEKSVAHWKNAIEEQKNQKNQLISKVLVSDYIVKLTNAENDLKAAQEWKPDYLNRYVSRDTKDVLVKNADCKFSFFNPKLQTRQEMKALFLLSADGKQCFRMIK